LPTALNLRLVLIAAATALQACALNPPTQGSAGASPAVDASVGQTCLSLGLPAIQAQAEHLQLLRPAAQEYRLMRALHPADRWVCEFQQVRGEIPVQFQEYTVHLSDDGRVLLSAGRYAQAAATQSVQPSIPIADIQLAAIADAKRILDAADPFVAPPTLLLTAISPTAFQLSYEVVVSRSDTGVTARLLYDAHSGAKTAQQWLKTAAQP